MSEAPLSISCLNDFVFCPVSIYFHMLDEGDRLLTQDACQLNGSDAHKKSDLAAYSTKKSMLQDMIIISYDIGNDKNAQDLTDTYENLGICSSIRSMKLKTASAS